MRGGENGWQDFIASTREKSAKHLGYVTESAAIEPLSPQRARQEAEELWHFYAATTHPRDHLAINQHPESIHWRIEAVTPPGENAPYWQVLATRENSARRSTISVELDPEFDWHVRRVATLQPNGRSWVSEFELSRIGGAVASARTINKNPDGVETTTTVRPLTAAEESIVCREVEAALEPHDSFSRRLRRPSTWAAAWTTMGVVVLAASRLPRPDRIAHRLAATSSEHHAE
jgi:hypothetical protein